MIAVRLEFVVFHGRGVFLALRPRLPRDDRGMGMVQDKIAGGFVMVNVGALMSAWRACRSMPLGVADFRCWLGCHEVRARRCTIGEDRAPSYSADELARLVGSTAKKVRASIRRLTAAGLLAWSESSIEFPAPAEPLGLDAIGGGRGDVAIPRRFLKTLVHGSRGSLIATALAALLRCLARRRDGWTSTGRLKAAWVAGAFGIGERAVRLARRELIATGWLEEVQTPPWTIRRYGSSFRVALDWGPISTGELAPSGPISTGVGQTGISPYGRNNDQDPDVGRRPTGIKVQRQETQTPISAHPDPTSVPGPLPVPKLDDVRPEDLIDVARTLDLHRQAAAKGLADPSEAGRLRFLALAEHARVIGSTNPPGLFAALLRRRAWSFITADDEDTARLRLREHLHGRHRPPGPPARRGSFVTFEATSPPSSLGCVLASVLASRGLAVPGVE